MVSHRPALISLLTATTLIGGCEHPENYRWNSDKPPAFPSSLARPADSEFHEWETPSVSVYSFATPADPPPTKLSIKDLSDSGQAVLLSAMTRPGVTPDDVRAAVWKALTDKAPETEGEAVIEGTYKRTLVATVTKGWSSGLADRLVWTWIDIRPVNFVFDGYTVLATDNQVLNIEQIQNQTTASLQGQLGKTGSGTTATTTSGSPVSSVVTAVAGSSAGLTANLSNQYTTSAAINQQYVKLGADILPNELRIYRESERNLDVAGNTLISLTMRADPDLWQRDLRVPLGAKIARISLQDITHRVMSLTVSKDGVLVSPADMTLKTVLEKSPPRCPLIANVTLYYEQRKVANARSYVEGEQNAEYVRQQYSPPRPVVIVPADVVRKPSWRIYGANNQAINLNDVFGQIQPIDFTSYEQARDFAYWLNQNKPWIEKGGTLSLGKEGLTLVGIDKDQPVAAGPYRPQRLGLPKDNDLRCQLMATPSSHQFD